MRITMKSTAGRCGSFAIIPIQRRWSVGFYLMHAAIWAGRLISTLMRLRIGVVQSSRLVDSLSISLAVIGCMSLPSVKELAICTFTSFHAT